MQKSSDLIKELLLNSKRSDRELAKKIKATQPTVGRLRKKLEKERNILEYTIVPELSKLNIELIAFIAIKWKDYRRTQDLDRFDSFVKKSNFVFFAAPGEGFQDKTKLIISLHQDYKAFELFLRGLRANFGEVFLKLDTFLISTDNVIKNFTFSGLANLLRK